MISSSHKKIKQKTCEYTFIFEEALDSIIRLTYFAEEKSLPRRHPSPRGSVRTEVQYVKNPVDKPCSPETQITTLEDCEKARKALAPNNSVKASAEKGIEFPGGCSIWHDFFFFNSMDGRTDGKSFPVCKVVSTPTATPAKATGERMRAAFEWTRA